MSGFRKTRRAFLLAGTAVAAGAYGAVAQARLIYFPSAYSPGDLAALERDGLRRVAYKTGQGQQTAFYKGPADVVPEKIWLLFCGNGARAADYRELAVRDDYGYLFVDYPGYGSCEGKASPRRIDASVSAALSALATMLETDEKALQGQLGAFGHSLGAAIALRSAVAYGIEDVVIVAPFTSMKAMAQAIAGKILSNALMHRYDNVKALTTLTAAYPHAQVTLFHGKADAVVPFAMGEELMRRFPKHIAFAPIEGSGHNDIVARQHRAITAAMAGR